MTERVTRETALKKLEPVIRDMIEWVQSGKCGSIEANFFKGGISNWNLKESKKLDVSR